VTEDGLYCGARFLAPRTEKYIQNYYEGLLASINSSAEKYDIGKVPVNSYLCPEYGVIQLYGDSLINLINKNSDSTHNTPPHSVACLQPLMQCITGFAIEGSSGHRFSIYAYAKSGSMYYVITCGHSNIKNMTVYQYGLKIVNNEIVTIENTNDDKIGKIQISFNPLKKKQEEEIKTDASLTEQDHNHYQSPEKRKTMFKSYYNTFDADNTTYIKYIETEGTKNFEEIKKIYQRH
jgi:hypothetical protein